MLPNTMACTVTAVPLRPVIWLMAMYFFARSLFQLSNTHPVASLSFGPGRYCSPRQRMPSNLRNQGSKWVSVTWRAMYLADIARQVIGCH